VREKDLGLASDGRLLLAAGSWLPRLVPVLGWHDDDLSFLLHHLWLFDLNHVLWLPLVACCTKFLQSSSEAKRTATRRRIGVLSGIFFSGVTFPNDDVSSR
jgi:hypothetical protein